MDYIEVNCTVSPVEPYSEIIVARLSELGYEMFEDTETGVKAYIQKSAFNGSYKEYFEDLVGQGVTIVFEEKFIPGQNWNEVWESNFEPVRVGNQVYVRAAFHPEQPEFKYTITIQPKMAFGTGHHATTAQVMEQMLAIDFEGKTVLDMGCGTGILAILAKLKGAGAIVAIDNDPQCVENTIDNSLINNVEGIATELGDATAIGNRTFDVILANINRNIILNDIGGYVKALNDNGLLILSGFYTDDIRMIEKAALGYGLSALKVSEQDKWSCLVYEKAA